MTAHYQLSQSSGVKDSKGREIGFDVYVTDTPDFLVTRGNGRFEIMVLGTRDGRRFGPGSRTGTFTDTLAEAKAAANDKLLSAIRRAQRKASR